MATTHLCPSAGTGAGGTWDPLGDTDHEQKRRRQVGILIMDDTDPCEGLGENNNIETVMEKGQNSINLRGSNLLAVGGEMRPDKYSYMVHKIKPIKDGEWEYAKEESVAQTSDDTTSTEELDNLWDDLNDDELDDLKSPGPGLTIPLANGDTAAMKKLSNNDAKKNLGMKIQPGGCNKWHLSALTDKVEAWTSKVDRSQLPTRAVWQSYTQSL